MNKMVLIYIYYFIITKQESLKFPHTSHTHVLRNWFCQSTSSALVGGGGRGLGVHWTGLFEENQHRRLSCVCIERAGGEVRQMGIITTVKLSGEIRRDLPDKSGSSLC